MCNIILNLLIEQNFASERLCIQYEFGLVNVIKNITINFSFSTVSAKTNKENIVRKGNCSQVARHLALQVLHTCHKS